MALPRHDAGLSVLVRSARRARPASARDLLAMAGAVPEVVAAVERSADGAAYSRSASEVGLDALLRANRGSAGVGQIVTSEENLGARVTQLDTDFNALLVAVYGTARGMPSTPTPAGVALGEAWRTAFLATVERWRSTRDDFRNSTLAETLLRSATVWVTRLDEYQREIERFSADVERVSGTRPTPSPPPAPTLPITIDTGTARAAEAARGIATAAAVGVVALVIGYIVFETQH